VIFVHLPFTFQSLDLSSLHTRLWRTLYFVLLEPGCPCLIYLFASTVYCFLFDIFILRDCCSFTRKNEYQSIPIPCVSTLRGSSSRRFRVSSYVSGVFNDFLSTIPENQLSTTHLLTTENHKPAVMLPIPVGELRRKTVFFAFSRRSSPLFCRSLFFALRRK